MGIVQQHFVEFCSPGTFVPETTCKPVDAWDVETAKTMALSIAERHGARPYGFYFLTRSRGEDDLDSKETASSNFYYLGGRVETLDQVRERADPKDRILLSNMGKNDIAKIVINDNSWRFTAELRETDVILDFEMPAREPQP